MFNQTISHHDLENYIFGYVSRSLGEGIKLRVLEQKHMFSEMEKDYGIDFKRMYSDKCSRTHDVFDVFVSKQAGCKNVYEYYEAAKLTDKIQNFNVKTLFLSAYDDVFTGNKSLPFEEIKKNQDTYLMVTHSGGHLAFYDKFLSPKQWSPIPCMKFINYLHSSNISE